MHIINLQRAHEVVRELQAKEQEEDLVMFELNMLVQHKTEKANKANMHVSHNVHEDKVKQKIQLLKDELNITSYKEHPIIQNLLSFMGDKWLNEEQAEEIIDSVIESRIRRLNKDPERGHARNNLKLLGHYSKASYQSVKHDLSLGRIKMRMIGALSEAGELHKIHYVHEYFSNI